MIVRDISVINLVEASNDIFGKGLKGAAQLHVLRVVSFDIPSMNLRNISLLDL
jgi:hypothetical protein